MYSEETKSSNLAKFLGIYDYVFLDTCSLMEDSFPAFMDVLTASREYWKDGFEVIVKGECVKELKKHLKSKESVEARIEAKRALKILRHDRWHKRILTITKSNKNYGFADNAIFTEVSSLRIQKKVLIITQDKTLASDLRKLNRLDSQRGRFLAVYRLNQTGELEENPGENGSYSSRNFAGNNKYSQNSSYSKLARQPSFKETKKSYDEPKKEEIKVEKSPLVAADERLCANLSQPNYPLDRKLGDIEAQIVSLNALSAEERSKLSLAYTLEQLKDEKAKLLNKGAKAPEKKAQAISAPKAVVPALAKPQPIVKKEEKPVQAKPTKKSWYEYGSTIQEALVKAGAHESIIFRDSSVPYFAMVHGPYDVTEQDLDALASSCPVLKPGESKSLPLKGLIANIEKTDKDYKCSLSIPVVEKAAPIAPVISKPVEKQEAASKPAPVKESPKEVKPAEKLAEDKPAPVKKSKRVTKKKEPVEEVKAPETKAPEKAKRAKSKKSEEKKVIEKVNEPKKAAKSSVTAPDEFTAVPAGVTLVVGVPTNEGKRGYIERKARREANPEVRIVKNPDAKHQQPQASIKKKEAKPAKAVQKKPSKSTFSMDEIVKEDKNLNAKINNPNYPKENKIADLKAQEAKVKTLSADEQKDLFFNLNKITDKLNKLK
jgi:rRNA-processing protein FCF1